MKKLILSVIVITIICTLLLCGCSSKSSSDQGIQFGQFGYKGKVLYDYAVRVITALEAKNILPNRTSAVAEPSATYASATYATVKDENHEFTFTPPADVVNKVLEQYAGCTVTTTYYVESSDSTKTKEDKIVGTDFKNMLSDNQFVPFNQLVAKNVLVCDELIDDMEEQNAAFQASDEALIAPFKNIFTYHVDKQGNLVLQTHDFAEIPASLGGGIGCSYRQDSEIVYDAEGKMTLWQTSLGLYSAAPEGTMQDGYILKITVDWIEKE